MNHATRTMARVALGGLLAAGCAEGPGVDGPPYLLKDIAVGTASSGPHLFTAIGEVTVFVARDATSGLELWRTDGTPEGTWLVKDIDPRPPQGFDIGSSSPYPLTRVGTRAFFVAREADAGSGLWATDGTTTGTVRLRSGAGVFEIADVGGVAFFSDHVGDTGRLWRSDGTPGGTRAVGPTVRGLRELTDVDGTLFFVATTPELGSELWRSDGTDAGTRLVKDVRPGPDPVYTGSLPYTPPGHVADEPRALVAVGRQVFFEEDRQLWRSDGTETGTTWVADVSLSEGARYGVSYALRAALPPILYFGKLDGLWRSDGTTAGTRRVKALRIPTSAIRDGFSSEIEVTSRVMYFVAAELPGWDYELWRSDGTEAGTRLVADLRAGDISRAGALTAVGERLYFLADDGVNGPQVWRTDGDASTTVRLTSLSLDGPFGRIGPRTLLLGAREAATGTELWAIPLGR